MSLPQQEGRNNTDGTLSRCSQAAVERLAGATITSRGVDSMLKLWLGEHGYGPYLEAQRGAL